LRRRIYYAHSNATEDREQWQRLAGHLNGTAERAGAFLETAGHAELGRVAGLLHDLGKYTDGFQVRLAGDGPRVDHSTAGARVAIDTYGSALGKMLAFCTAGHHAGLANGTNGTQITALADRLGNEIATPDPIWKQEILLPDSLKTRRIRPRSLETAAFSAAFLIRMIFSALVDADWLDTEAYHAADDGKPISRGAHPALAELQKRLDVRLNALGKVRWSRFFGPVVKVYSRTSGRHWNDDETATTVHGELQEAGGARRAAGRPYRAGDRSQARDPSEPGRRLEAPGNRRVGGGLRGRQSVARLRARGDGPGPAREDRRVDGGAGFFSARLATLSRAARLELVERGGALSVRRQCALLGINRSSVYYRPREERAENLALMRRMDELSLQYPFYGSRQMARHLGREGVSVGRRRVRRLMRLMGLEAVYRKPRTSAAQPGHRIYPYLLRELTIDRPDQVWCADITYIPVTAGFLYLVAVMDWASRHVLAWRLSNTMDTGFCIEALEAALRTGTPEIFNTDQGAQFMSTTFTERVLAAGAQCSMDGRGRCLDNVFIERLWRSLKYEAVYLHELTDGFEAERVIGAWMTFYSDVRPHSALGGRTPAEAYGEERAA